VEVVFGIALYFLPTIVALARKMPNVGSVIVINLFLGWTIIGWIVALAMSLGSPSAGGIVINNTVGNWVGGLSTGASSTPRPASARGVSLGSASSASGTAMWAKDPYQVAAQRYFDGTIWTTNVSSADGVQATAPADFLAPEAGAGWAIDPFGRFDKRYHDSKNWTEHVCDSEGATASDIPTAPPPSKAKPKMPPPPVAPRSDEDSP